MVKVNLKSQNGRSMVEMLGVLAIIGVLSVGGVYGYGVAMKKHKANEALHKASMLATTVSAYAMSNDGNLPSSIADFANLGYYTELSDNGTQFKLTMKGVGYDVCKQMESSMGGMVRNVTCVEGSDDVVITYYKNLATNETEGEKSPTGGNGVGGCSSVCKIDEECIDGNCVKSKTTDGTCAKNSDCDDWCKTGETCYCAIEVEETENPSSCYNNFRGACAVATKKTGVGGGYIVSNEGINWWSAVNFCKAYDMSLASLADVGITGGYEACGDCMASTCLGTVNWTDLKAYLGSDQYLLKDAAMDNNDGCWQYVSNDNSCFVFFLIPNDKFAGSDTYRNNTYYKALCID